MKFVINSVVYEVDCSARKEASDVHTKPASLSVGTKMRPLDFMDFKAICARRGKRGLKLCLLIMAVSNISLLMSFVMLSSGESLSNLGVRNFVLIDVMFM